MTYREEWKDFIKRELVTGSFGTELELIMKNLLNKINQL